MITLIKLMVILFVYWVSPVFGTTYWVSPTGSTSWSGSPNCQSSTDPGSNYCSLQTANRSLAAGDTVYLKGGTYTLTVNFGTGIEPTNTGTSGNKITYVAFAGETPIITQNNYATNTNYGIFLMNKRYIVIDGITFKNINTWAYIWNYSSYNEIKNCTFTSDSTTTDIGTGFSITGGFCEPSHDCWTQHNWIHNNTFSRRRASDPCGEAINIMSIGIPYVPSYGTATNLDSYNTIENNYFEHAGHAMIDNFGMYNVIKNNVMHNEPWIAGCTTSDFTPIYVNTAYNGLYGHRNLHLTDDYARDATYVLVEGNRLGHASTNPGNAGPMNLDLGAPSNIVRYNYLYNGMQVGLYFKLGGATARGTGAKGGINNRVYNNTIYHNGYGYDWITYGGDNYSGHGIAQSNLGSNPTNNVVKNNIVYDSHNGDICSLWTAAPCSPTSDDTVTNNWITSNGDPKFVNPDVTNTSSSTLPNLALQPSSPAIDGGTYLTQANGSGSGSTTLIVNDALYFQDGTWGSDLARGVTLFPDWIAIGTVSNVVQISSINYSKNTITLASPMTWSNGANIWLYKKSGGTRVLYGSAPDYGAYEYSGRSQIGIPTNLHIIP